MTAGRRDQLAEVLRQHPDLTVLWPSSDRIADALLPIVDRMCAEAAADALEAVADDLDSITGARWIADSIRTTARRLTTDQVGIARPVSPVDGLAPSKQTRGDQPHPDAAQGR